MFKTKITLPELEQNFIGSYNKKQDPSKNLPA